MSNDTENKKDEYAYQIVDGKKIYVLPRVNNSEVDKNGYFRRQGNYFTRPFANADGSVEGDPENKTTGLGKIVGSDLYGRPTSSVIREEDGTAKKAEPLKAEPYRYRIVWAKGCHWSNRQSIVRELEGLEDAISINLVNHTDGEYSNLGWAYVYNKDGKDPLTGDRFLGEAYIRGNFDYQGRPTVPALIDLKAKGGPAVVNNDYNWLSVYLETAFRPFHKKGAPELYPKALRSEIDKLNFWIFDNINNSVYRCWLGNSREGYEQGYRTLYAALDVLEKRLSTKRFLFGDYVTDSDIRLFVTLTRLDISYTGTRIGETKHRLIDYPNIWGYARDLWQIPAFRNNTFFADFAAPGVNAEGQYKASYNYRFLRQIDFDALWGQPTDRARLSDDPAHKFQAETDGGTARDGDGFIGYTQTPEEKAAWEEDAKIYESIHSVKSTEISWKEGPVIKDPSDIPEFKDDRPQNVQAIEDEIAEIPEKPDLTLESGTAEEEREKVRKELASVRTYVKNNVTDTITTLLTAVKLQDFEDAYAAFYAALDRIDSELSEKRFLLGDYISTADVELFATLVRFDSQYSRHLGPTKHRLVDYKNLWGYARDLYMIPEFYHNVDWSTITAKVPRNAPGYLKNAFYDYIQNKTDRNEVWRTETERAYLSDDPTHEFLLTDNKRFDR